MKEKRNNFLLRLVGVFFISTLFFFTVKTVPASVYFLMVDSILFWLVIKYSVRKNRRLFSDILYMAGTNAAAYLTIRTMQKDVVSWSLYGRNWYVYLVVLCYIGLILGIHIVLIFGKTQENIDVDFTDPEMRAGQDFRKVDASFSPWFIASRREDLLRLEEYLSFSPVVGVNGAWGTGKSCLLEEFARRHRQEIYMLRVDVLTCNLNEVDMFLLQEMERILRKERIYPRVSKELRSIITEHSLLKEAQQFWGEIGNSKAEVLDAYRKDIQKLEKTILIAVEDLDRIQNIEQMKKLMDFTERLSGGKIKVVYEYDSEMLENAGVDWTYLEKYIPYIVNLTNISFQDVIRYYFPEYKDYSKYTFLTGNVSLGAYVSKVFGFDAEMAIHLKNPSLRKVKHFLQESNAQLQKPEFKEKTAQKTVLAFYFMKHFFPDFYESLTFYGDCKDEIKFEVPQTKERYSFQELLNLVRLNQEAGEHSEIGLSADEVKMLFSEGAAYENRCGLILLRLLGYNFQYMDEQYQDKKQMDEGTGERRKRVYEFYYMRSEEALKHAEENDKISALIRNLHANGNQKNTQSERKAKLFVSEVLEKEDQITAWDTLLQSEKISFYMGINEYVELAKSLRLLLETTEWKPRAQEVWYKFVIFYHTIKKRRQKNQITLEYLAMCNYIDARFHKVFLEVIRNFNAMEIVGKPEEQKVYLDFLRKYSYYAWKTGFLEQYDDWRLDVTGKKETKALPLMQDYLAYIIQTFQNDLETRQYCSSVREDVEEVLHFFRKNAELLVSEKNTEWENDFQFNINTKSHYAYVDEETYKQLEKLAESGTDKSNFEMCLNQAYMEDRVSVREVKWLYGCYERHKKSNLYNIS